MDGSTIPVGSAVLLDPPDPHPLTAALDAHIADIVSKIPSSGRGAATFSLATTGAQIGIGQKIGQHGTLSGWAGLDRAPTGSWQNLSAGIKGAFDW